MRVGGFRRRAKIPYPNAYASAEQIKSAETEEHRQAMYLFNCAQRAHYNFLEHYVIALPALLVAGVGYPRSAAVFGLIWSVGRALYATGYTNPNKEKGAGRYNGMMFYIGEMGLIGLVGKMAYDVLMG